MGLPVVSETTFGAFADWYEAHHTDKHRSAERERAILARLRDHFSHARLNAITPAAWSEYDTRRRAGYGDRAPVSASTVGRELAVMKALLTTAIGQHLEANPLGLPRSSSRGRRDYCDAGCRSPSGSM